MCLVSEMLTTTLYSRVSSSKRLLNNCHSLDDYHFFLFKKLKASSTKEVLLEALSPTSDANMQHCLRVHQQILLWKGIHLPPTKWGRKKGNNGLEPVPMTRAPAPQHILSLISCACKMGCQWVCTCRKAGLRCTSICAHCAGTRIFFYFHMY